MIWKVILYGSLGLMLAGLLAAVVWGWIEDNRKGD